MAPPACTKEDQWFLALWKVKTYRHSAANEDSMSLCNLTTPASLQIDEEWPQSARKWMERPSRQLAMNFNKDLKRCPQHEDCVHRQPIAPPGSLQEICFAKLKVAVISASERRLRDVFNLAESKKSMKEYLSQLPITCREQLLVKIMVADKQDAHWKFCMDERNAHCKLGIAEILFSEGVTKLELSFKGTFSSMYFNTLVQLISTEGKRLRTLKLESIYIRMNGSHYGHFRNIFTSAQNLSTLILPYICDDVMLKLIGQHCSSLQILDVSSSRFTDKGIHLLTQNIVRLPPGTVNSDTTWESIVWGLPDIFLPLQKLVPPGQQAENYDRKKSHLCETLRSLDLGQSSESNFFGNHLHMDDNISSKTMMALLEMIPKLQSLGNARIDKLCEDNDLLTAMTMENIFQLPSLSLTSAVLHSMNVDKVSIVSRLLPNLVRLECLHHDPPALMAPWSLDTFNAFDHLEWLSASCSSGVLTNKDLRVLSPGVRENLRELEILALSSPDPFKLDGIVTYPRLTRLQLTSPTFVWDGGECISSLEHLNDVDLHGTATVEVVIKILQCAPNLQKLRILDIIDRKPDFLQKIMGIDESSKLESFELMNGFLIDTEEELRSFLTHFEKIQHVGKIRFLQQW